MIRRSLCLVVVSLALAPQFAGCDSSSSSANSTDVGSDPGQLLDNGNQTDDVAGTDTTTGDAGQDVVAPDVIVAVDTPAGETGPDATSDDTVVASDPGTDEGNGTYHPQGWTDPTSGTFHGDTAKQGIGACTGCHGANLDGGSVGISCENCHSGFRTNCTFCHGGTDNALGSPPIDIHGATATSEITVGAHSSHVQAKSNIASAIDCTACHVKPTNALDAGHIDGSPAEVNADRGWNRAAVQCATAYCHGNFVGGTSTNHPAWNQVGTGQAACGTCHATPPRTGRHGSVFGKHSPQTNQCSNCHNGIAGDGGTTILDPTRHINGTKDVVIKNGTWNAATKSCDPSCHGAKTW